MGVEDLFVNFKHIKIDGYKTLKHHQQVTFELATGEKGLMAENVCEA